MSIPSLITLKAVIGMAEGLCRVVGDVISGGVVVTKNIPKGINQVGGKIGVLQGSHPIPDNKSVAGAKRIQEEIAGLRGDDLVFCLISGGGSALMADPMGDVTLGNLQQLTSILLACGATINEMNTIRKHLDRVKGGGLLRIARPAKVVTLILSDVVGNPLETIASGPTVPDLSTYQDAVSILEKYQILEKTPQTIVEALRQGVDGDLPETIKPNDPDLERVQNVLVGSNEIAAEMACKMAESEGFRSAVLTTTLQGEARDVGKHLAITLRQVVEHGHTFSRPACLIAGGETTVTIRGSGMGGRNQEVALGAVEPLSGLDKVALITLGTDGEDGPTSAAGAAVTGDTLVRAQLAGLDPNEYLIKNDSHNFFKQLGDLVQTGPTGTNVNDLNFLFAF